MTGLTLLNDRVDLDERPGSRASILGGQGGQLPP